MSTFNAKRFGLLTGLVAVSLLGPSGSPTYGSGTYRPPYGAFPGTQSVERDKIDRGKKLFEGSQLVGTGGKSCVTCHSDSGGTPLKRASLKRKAYDLTHLINVCLEDKKRSAGKPLTAGSPPLVDLGTYLVARYLLPPESMDYIKGGARAN